jgi:DNA-binding NtrC family response regulator
VLAESTRAPSCPTEPGLVIENPAMKNLYALAARLATRNVPVLIVGETGTGKEHLARALHAGGSRSDGPFVTVNCAAITATLAESTLFGHERGAFTGATARTEGFFEQAHGGVLFLDEIGDMPLAVQPMLLRVLETGRVTRLGASGEIEVDVRVVGATHREIDPRAPGGSFRPDLYYRLGTVVLKVPPLRERGDEIPPLARAFLAQARRGWGSGPTEVSPAALRALEAHDWPGNVRELRHVLHRAALLGNGSKLEESDLPKLGLDPFSVDTDDGEPEDPGSLEDGLMQYEKQLIVRALERAGGNRTVAADLLQVPRRTFYRRLRLHGL